MKKFRMMHATRVVAALAASTATLGLGGLLTSQSAGADPAYSGVAAPLVGVGSNTIEDLFDAYSGVAPTPGITLAGNSTYHIYTPLHDPTSFQQLYSFDAVNPSTVVPGDCISTKPGGDSFARPNGSGNGRIALSDAVVGQNWSAASSSCAAAPVAGQIDFSRSSSAPGTTASGTQLTWVDFARDAISYGYYGKSLSSGQISIEQNLTKANLAALYNSTTTGTTTVTVGSSSLTLYACLPQTGSGTEKTFLSDIGVTQANGEAAAEAAGCFNGTAGLEENGANAFYTAASTQAAGSGVPAGSAAVVPFSVGSWISQANGVAQDRSSVGRGAGVDLGNLDGDASGAKPYNGTAPNETADTTFYASQYGRELYVIVPYLKVNGRPGQFSSTYRGIFGYGASPTSGAICQAPYHTTTLTAFGFLDPVNGCGSETNTVATPGTGS